MQHKQLAEKRHRRELKRKAHRKKIKWILLQFKRGKKQLKQTWAHR